MWIEGVGWGKLKRKHQQATDKTRFLTSSSTFHVSFRSSKRTVISNVTRIENCVAAEWFLPSFTIIRRTPAKMYRASEYIFCLIKYFPSRMMNSHPKYVIMLWILSVKIVYRKCVSIQQRLQYEKEKKLNLLSVKERQNIRLASPSLCNVYIDERKWEEMRKNRDHANVFCWHCSSHSQSICRFSFFS